ncbi:MAG: hypothetical protein E4G96_03405 [Chrysiogenales bacterium]|nr:MAG: hypothetical protein E4G96_03405 [Chrysiogenales bacterium]
MSDVNDDPGIPGSFLVGIPVEPDVSESWGKNRLSCSGSGKIGRNFDLKYLDFLAVDKDNAW